MTDVASLFNDVAFPVGVAIYLLIKDKQTSDKLVRLHEETRAALVLAAESIKDNSSILKRLEAKK